MKQPIILVVLFIIFSCKNDNRSKNQVDEKSQSVNRIYTIFEKHQLAAYAHYVTLSKYKDEPLEYFLQLASRYRDTCSTDIPISSITFSKTFTFKKNYDSRDFELLNEHSIVTINYSEETLLKKIPDITSIAIYKDGKPNYVSSFIIDQLGAKE